LLANDRIGVSVTQSPHRRAVNTFPIADRQLCGRPGIAKPEWV
jgi:hypothetical protein